MKSAVVYTQWALYKGLTYKVCGECTVNNVAGWILKTESKLIRAKKSDCEVY